MTAITQVDMTESDSDQSSTLKTNRENSLLSFPAASEDHRYLRKRAAILCAAFNSLPIDAPDVDRARAWHDIVSPKTNYDGSDVAMIKAPIQIDYGLNVRIHPSCFINRDCFIADSPDCMVSIGEHTVIGVSARILGVTHPRDWRERKGRQGPSVAGDVVIGKNCFIGANVIVLPGITIEDGCVIGAGSVVTKNVPAYHVAAGNPARVIRKVAPDVPDAPDLLYESDGGRSKVRRPKTNTEHGHGRQSLGKTRRQQAARQNPPDAGSFMANLVPESKEHRAALLTAGLLVVAGMVGFWLGGHPMA